MLLLEKRGPQVLERHPAGPGLGRPPRIASVARRFLEMTEEVARDGDGHLAEASEPAGG
jgi:hypothetical protein